jgi:hypothetical protein
MATMLHYWFLAAWLNLLHPFFVSVTEITHNNKDKSLELTCRIFTDDFEKTLSAAYKTKVDILHPKDKKQTDQWVFDYISKHLRIKLDGKPVTLSFVGYQQEEDAIWSYLEIRNVTSFKTIEITNDLLFESHEEQINIVHVIKNGERKSRELRNPDSNLKFEFP